MSRKRKGQAHTKPYRNTKSCPWCTTKTTPDWKQPDILRRYLKKAGEIQSWKKTRACDRHQRALAKAVKNAREMALLPATRPRYKEYKK